MGNTLINHNKNIKLNVSKSDYWDFIISSDKDGDFYPNGYDLYDDNIITYVDFNDANCVSGDSIYSLSGYTWNQAYNDGVELNNIGFVGIDNGLIKFDIDSVTEQQFIDILTGSTYTINSGDTRLFLNKVSGNTKNFIYPIEFIAGETLNYVNFNGGFYQGVFSTECNYSVLPTNNDISFEIVLKPDLFSTPSGGTLNEIYPDNKGLFLYLGARAENKFNYLYEETGDTKTYSGLTLDNNIGIYNSNYSEIETDNKYVLFNRSKTGKIASTYDSTKKNTVFVSTEEDPNFYVSFNRSKTGSTASNKPSKTIYELNRYKINDDLINNAIGFLIKDDGSIGYRMITETCTGNTYQIEEEYSLIDTIKNDEWQSVFIKLVNNKQGFNILIYVNAKLVLVSKTLPRIDFRNLNDLYKKQELVPYNISLGGGTQGLIEMVNLSSKSPEELPLQKYFAGSFIGGIKNFKIYDGNIDYSKILNNYMFDFNLSVSDYLQPFIDFILSGVTVNANFETNYVREKGNVYSNLIADIEIRTPNENILGYKLYFSVNDENTYQEIYESYDIEPSGETISYLHEDSSLLLLGLDKIKYMIEVFDMKKQNVGAKKLKTIDFKNAIFYGGSNQIPSSSSDVRSLENKKINFDSVIILNTGSINKTFVIALPCGYIVESVYDEDALYVNLTNYYVKSNTLTQIQDAGGLNSGYNVYIMQNAIPYSSNHKHKITIVKE